MTTNLVDLDDHRPHIAGPVLCLRCENEWTAVRQLGAEALECPKCSAMMGYGWSNVRNAFKVVLGEECCGQVDSDGVCCAPACTYGSALKLATLVHRLGIIEFGDYPRES